MMTVATTVVSVDQDNFFAGAPCVVGGEKNAFRVGNGEEQRTAGFDQVFYPWEGSVATQSMMTSSDLCSVVKPIVCSQWRGLRRGGWPAERRPLRRPLRRR